MNVAQTILAQLGGNRFIAMTGAREFVGSNDALRFRIPRTSKGATICTVTLDPSDTYTVTLGRIGRVDGLPSFVKLDECAFVYADQLQTVFTSRTGYDTRL